MRTKALVGAALLAVTTWACGSSTPAAPRVGVGDAGGGGGGVTTITILGADSSGTFNPSPANIGQGSSMVWSNVDSEVHRIVAVDGSFDTGDIQPGDSSAAIVLRTDGARYYCALHDTTEFGIINNAQGAAPPCDGPHCGSSK